MALEYAFWMAVTVLVAVGLGKLKRWLWDMAEKLRCGDCSPAISVNNTVAKMARGGVYEKNGDGLSGISAAQDPRAGV